MEAEEYMAIAVIIGGMLAPLYGFVFWNFKLSLKIKIKVVKLMTVARIVHPEHAKILEDGD